MSCTASTLSMNLSNSNQHILIGNNLRKRFLYISMLKNHLEGLINTDYWAPVGLGWSLRIYNSNKHPGGVDPTDLRTILRELQMKICSCFKGDTNILWLIHLLIHLSIHYLFSYLTYHVPDTTLGK